jgi:hypothetical protein
MRRISWVLAVALALPSAGCIAGPEDGGQPPPALDAGPPALDAGAGPADAAPAADAGAGPVDAAPALDAGADAMVPALDADACEHMMNGPGQGVTPVESAALDGDDVKPGHVRWDAGYLIGASGYLYGFADLVVEESGEISIYKSAELEVRVSDVNGAVQVAESIEPATCTTMMERHTFDLGAGAYELFYGSFYASTQFVVLGADDAGH